MKNRIVIEVSGGIVNGVYTDDPHLPLLKLSFVVVDLDNRPFEPRHEPLQALDCASVYTIKAVT